MSKVFCGNGQNTAVSLANAVIYTFLGKDRILKATLWTANFFCLNPAWATAKKKWKPSRPVVLQKVLISFPITIRGLVSGNSWGSLYSPWRMKNMLNAEPGQYKFIINTSTSDQLIYQEKIMFSQGMWPARSPVLLADHWAHPSWASCKREPQSSREHPAPRVQEPSRHHLLQPDEKSPLRGVFVSHCHPAWDPHPLATA